MAGTTMEQRRGAASLWSTANPILKAGEIGVTTDTGVMKVGDGVNNWNALPVFQDSVLFRGATDLATPNALVKRDASGRVSFADPTATGHAATKNYVDNTAGTSAATASALARRDAAGRFQVASPSVAADVATKGYADALGVSTPTVSTIARRDAAGRFQAVDPSVAADVATKGYADALGVSLPTVSTIVRRDAAGRFQAVDPAVSADVSTKNYVDGLVLPAGANRQLLTHWGSVAAFPTGTQVKVGDRCTRTDLGTGGSEWVLATAGWRLAGSLIVADLTARNAIPTAVRYAGMQVWITAQDQFHVWDATNSFWRGTSEITWTFKTSTDVSAANDTVYRTIASGAIPDPGFPYQIALHFKNEMAMNSAVGNRALFRLTVGGAATLTWYESQQINNVWQTSTFSGRTTQVYTGGQTVTVDMAANGANYALSTSGFMATRELIVVPATTAVIATP